MKAYGPSFRPTWEFDRGAPVAVATLQPGYRVFPIASPFERVPEVGCHPSHVRLFGSFYLMTLDEQEPAVQLAVSAQTTDYAVDGEGFIEEPSRIGGDFFTFGIAANGTHVVTPEQAVAAAARSTGALVAEVPRLTRRVVSQSPTAALWRVAFEREVTVRRGDGTSLRTRTLYVSPFPDERFQVASPQQPATVSHTCRKVDENLVDHGWASFTVKVLVGHPIEFELAAPQR